ncbi:DUF222 domain-containing protein [Cryobacterium serini]|uniref:DUF222 domain-containing protein n=1 Tax=Cryobacterium serini TaxID=1259201 RepID=A0A4R9BRN8_9MICO|nr:DUF222 domain-containing protein [Cryobacterium serini]TFD89028.1 DUF222 domain-containing protein [Cryobacterium serini]
MTLTAPPAATGSVPEPEGSRVAAVAQAAAILALAFDGVRFGQLDDSEAVAVMAALEGLGRKVDGARLRATTDIGVRAETDLGTGSLAYKNGCRNRVEFITQLAGISGREAKRRLKLGETTVERTPLGLPVPARYPAIAAGLSSGDLGVESAEIIATTLTALHGKVLQDDLDHVERALVATATGAITPETAGLPGAGIRFAPDLLRAQALEWQGRLDPDGTAPTDDLAEAKSTLTFGLLRNGLYPLRADVTPELRGIMDTLFDTYLSARSRTPRFEPTEPDDSTGVGTVTGTDAPRERSHLRRRRPTGHHRHQRRHPPPQRQNALLQPQTTSRDQCPRRRLHHPRLHHPRLLVRSPPRHPLAQTRPHHHRQRHPPLLVPPPHHRHQRLEHPHHQRQTPNTRTTTLGPHPNLAASPHPPGQHPQPQTVLAHLKRSFRRSPEGHHRAPTLGGDQTRCDAGRKSWIGS